MARKRNTNISGKPFSQEVVDAVWRKGSIIRGKDPDLNRRDDCGNELYKPSYGKETEMGWEIDHIKPVAKGGTDHLNNLRPLQSATNAEKGDTHPWHC